MRKFNWGCRIEVTKDKYSAICGSDIGAVFNGEIVAECSAL